YNYLAFYRAYPQIVRTVSAQFRALVPDTLIDSEILPTMSAQFGVPAEQLLNHLSYSQFELLTAIEDPLKRAFYEVQSIRGGWSVRELKRQIASLLYERTGLSRNKATVLAFAQTRCPFRKSCASALPLGAPDSSPASEATLERGAPRENPKLARL